MFGIAAGVAARNLKAISSPNNISGCIVYLSADLGLTQSGNVLSSWADQSSNAYTLSNKSTTNFAGYNATGGPNSLPVVTFSGSQSIGNGSITPITGTIERTPCTWYIVQKSTSSQTTYRTYSGTYALLSQGTTRSWRAPSVAQDVNVAGMSLTNFECWCGVTANDGTSFMRINGVQSASISTSSGGTATANFWLGAASNGSNPWTGGSLYLCYVFNRVLSPSEFTEVERYIRAKTSIW